MKFENMNFMHTILYLSIVLFLSCQDTPLDPYYPPKIDEEEDIEDVDENFDPLDDIYNDYEWVSKINKNHPRLFFNEETFIDVKKRAFNEEKQLFDAIKNSVDALLGQPIVIRDPLIKDGQDSDDHTLGTKAAESALVYLITEDPKYFELSKQILEKVTEYYQMRNRSELSIAWYSYSRIHALMAYDWLYNELSDDDRGNIGTALFEEVSYMLPSVNRPNFHRENRSNNITAGFYGNQSLEWYLGLAFLGNGIDDSKALEILKMGYDSHMQVLNFRRRISGDDGGASTATLSYSIPDYPWAEFNFFNTFISATGGYNITTQFDYLVNFPNYIYWNILPKLREFGFGDARHTTNSASYPILNMHLSQIVNFYSDRFPQHSSLTKWMMNEMYPRTRTIENPNFSMARLFLNSEKIESIVAVDPSDKIPTARHFENMGQFFMRSGSGPDDTYATFTVSPTFTQHKHFDNNNFNIYRKGFLSLDTGTRPSPGIHLSHYYPRTVAHNCITIRMPGEILPGYWGHGLAPGETNQPVPNDGGQNSVEGTWVVAFDEKDEYVYIASDATGSYNTSKANLVLRQFVFLPPNNFVIFDRVNSTNKDYTKRWLLHTAYKPTINGNEFYHNYEEGRLICKTLYPENASLELIGGPGKQFWSDGKNWPLPTGDDGNPLYGQWRVEVSPAAPEKETVFLNLIQVGDNSGNVRSIPTAKKIEEDGMKGVEFTYEGKDYKVLFATTGQASGRISIIENGSITINETFSNSVKEQVGLSFN